VLPKKIEFKIGHIIPTLSLWLPLIIGITALKSDSLIVRTFSAQLPAGFIVYHNLISKVCSLSAGLITIGIQILFLPSIIEKIANKDFQKTGEMVNKVKAIVIALSVLLALAVYFISPFFIKIFFVGGKFTISDFDQVVTLIPYYLIPVFGWGIISVFLQPLYALKKHFHVGILNIICFSVAWLVASEISKTSPSLAISVGLSILLLGSALGSEIIWQINFNKLKKSS
jgi:peptidoglycan biosynthesis protein MviN/MurJ (putative lipid II flippase)